MNRVTSVIILTVELIATGVSRQRAARVRWNFTFSDWQKQAINLNLHKLVFWWDYISNYECRQMVNVASRFACLKRKTIWRERKNTTTHAQTIAHIRIRSKASRQTAEVNSAQCVRFSCLIVVSKCALPPRLFSAIWRIYTPHYFYCCHRLHYRYRLHMHLNCKSCAYCYWLFTLCLAIEFALHFAYNILILTCHHYLLYSNICLSVCTFMVAVAADRAHSNLMTKRTYSHMRFSTYHKIRMVFCSHALCAISTKRANSIKAILRICMEISSDSNAFAKKSVICAVDSREWSLVQLLWTGYEKSKSHF